MESRFYGLAVLGVIIWRIVSVTALSSSDEVNLAEGSGVERSADGGPVDNPKDDPVQTIEEYRLRQAVAEYSEQWYGMIRADVPAIKDLARKTRVPGEAILGAIFVEDIRFFSPDWASAISYTFFKASLRRALPNGVLTRLGHNPNPPPNRSFYGIVWDSTFNGALQYLLSLPDLDKGTKQLISTRTIAVEFWGDDNGPSRTRPSYSFSTIERMAIVLKANLEYWTRAGYDILSYKFDRVRTLGERIGVLVTLNNIFSYHPGTAGVGKQRSGVCSSCFHNSTRAAVPHRDPRLGGTNLWGWTNYGNVARAFVDMKIARNILERREDPKTAPEPPATHSQR